MYSAKYFIHNKNKTGQVTILRIKLLILFLLNTIFIYLCIKIIKITQLKSERERESKRENIMV